MKRKIAFIAILLFAAASVFGFTDQQLELAHNAEFALYQRLQLDTVIARKKSDSRVVLAELSLRDLVPTMSDTTKYRYGDFNRSILDLKMVDIGRERLEYLLKEKQKGSLTKLVPNVFATGMAAIASAGPNPLGAIIGVAGMVASSVTGYLDEKSKVELEYLQKQWELDDKELETLTDLGIEQYGYKCDMAKELGIPVELTLSEEDLESFVEYAIDEDPIGRYVHLEELKGRLDLLPDYWFELAKAYYEAGKYQKALDCISKFEEIYCPIIYHDTNYAELLMIKSDCVNKVYKGAGKYRVLESIGDELLKNIKAEDWCRRFYALRLYMEIYGSTKVTKVLEKAYGEFSYVLDKVIRDYDHDLESYLSGAFIEACVRELDEKIKNAEKELSDVGKISKGDKYTSKKAKETDDKEVKEKEKALADAEKDKKEFLKTADLWLPPSPDFLVSMMREYVEVSEKLGRTNDDSYKAICNIYLKTAEKDFRLKCDLDFYIKIGGQWQSYKWPDWFINVQDTGLFKIPTHPKLRGIFFPLSSFEFLPEKYGKAIESLDLRLNMDLYRYIFQKWPVKGVAIVKDEKSLDTSFLYVPIEAFYKDKFELGAVRPFKDYKPNVIFRLDSPTNAFKCDYRAEFDSEDPCIEEIQKRIKWKENKKKGKNKK